MLEVWTGLPATRSIGNLAEDVRRVSIGERTEASPVESGVSCVLCLGGGEKWRLTPFVNIDDDRGGLSLEGC